MFIIPPISTLMPAMYARVSPLGSLATVKASKSKNQKSKIKKKRKERKKTILAPLPIFTTILESV
jgi:hypothetical protein